MQRLINQIHSLLIKNKKSVAVAESCTGGLLSCLLTRMPRSSRYFTMGIVAYNNSIKINFLKIPSRLIAQKGAVSQDVAALMAKSAKKLSKSDLGIGITGIAGPAGGSIQKPVGTVFIALNAKGKKICKRFIFKGNRSAIRKKTAFKALELLKSLLIK